MEKLESLWYFIVGLVQGVSEPFPVSSSAQTLIATRLTKLNKHSSIIINPKGEAAFNLMLNLGSAIAITLILLPTIKKLISGLKKYFKNDRTKESIGAFNTSINIIITTVITSVLGLLLKSKIESFVGSKYSVIIMGIILFVVMIPVVLTINYLTGNRKIDQMKPWEAILVGIAQTLALIPGISRSGLTLLTLKSRKFSIISAIKYSFLVYLPVSLLVIAKSLLEAGGEILHYQFLIGALAAFIGTYATFNIMVSMAKRKTLKYVTSWLVLSSILAIVSFVM